MDKPNDGSPSTQSAQPEITIDGGELSEETKGIATAEDFRKDWECRGRPQGIFGMLTNPLDPASLPIEEIERLGKIAKEASELWPRMKDLQAAAEHFRSWNAVQDSTLKMIRENPELLTGLLPKAGSFAAFGLEPWPELLKQIAEAARLVTEARGVHPALESMYAFPLRRFLTETLAEGAVQYIRQTTPELAKQQIPPVGTETRDTAPRREDARAEEKPISPRIGEMLLNTAANSLALLDAELQEQAAIVRTPAEWETLRAMKAQGKGKEIGRWLNKRAQEAIRACKRRLGIQRGRRPKAKTETAGYKVALKVAALLPEFERWMSEKKQLKKKCRSRRERIESELSKRGIDPRIVHSLMTCQKALTAVCQYVADTVKPKRETSTVQNYYSRFRCIIPLPRSPSEPTSG